MRSFFDEWLLSSGKAPRRVIARYGEERQRSMTATDTVKKEQHLRDTTLDQQSGLSAVKRRAGFTAAPNSRRALAPISNG